MASLPATVDPASPQARLRSFGIACAAFLLFVLSLVPASDLTLPGAPASFALMGLSAAAAWYVAVLRFEALPQASRPWIFWTVALTLRGVMLLAHPADDFWRYLWEGRIQAVGAGLNPYVFEPASLALVPRRTPWWPLINHPDWPAIYPPGAEVLFARLSLFTENAFAWKFVFGLLDLLTVVVLVRLRWGPGCYRTVAWYAWNPLAIYSFAGAGHYDSAMILALVLAYGALCRALHPGEPHPNRWVVAAGLFLGAAIGLKAAPLLLVPLWTFALRRRAVGLAPGLLIPVVLALMYGAPGVDVTGPLRDFMARARTNDLLWWIVEAATGPRSDNGLYNLVLLGVCSALGWFFRNDPARGTLWVLGATLLLSPVLHAWYVCWILPFAALRRSAPWLVLSGSVFAYFLLWETSLFWTPWQQPVWQRLLILLPPIACAFALWVLPRLPSADTVASSN